VGDRGGGGEYSPDRVPHELTQHGDSEHTPILLHLRFMHVHGAVVVHRLPIVAVRGVDVHLVSVRARCCSQKCTCSGRQQTYVDDQPGEDHARLSRCDGAHRVSLDRHDCRQEHCETQLCGHRHSHSRQHRAGSYHATVMTVRRLSRVALRANTHVDDRVAPPRRAGDWIRSTVVLTLIRGHQQGRLP
jgi:hypothetical protein